MRSGVLAWCTRAVLAVGFVALAGGAVGCASGESTESGLDASVDGSFDDARSFPGDGTIGGDANGEGDSGGSHDGATTDGSNGNGGDGGADATTDGAQAGDAEVGDAQEEEAGCPGTTVRCQDVCTSTATDPYNCGACGVSCKGGMVCANGACTYNCPPMQTLCEVEGGVPDGGTFGVVDAQAPDAEAPDAALGDGGLPSGLYCATLPSDPNNCGGCGVACPVGNDTPDCVKSTCGIGSCNPGFTNCDGITQNGCEVDTGGDPNNCGACGFVCKVPNATAGCSSGSCTVGMCNPGWLDCDMSPTDGCEVNGQNGDIDNCGACNHVCTTPNATPGCTNGACSVLSCNPGFANCNNVASDGCEINTTNNPSDCGACGTVCTLPNATATCSNSACAIGSCNAGWADCDGIASNGCETNISVNTMDCGACGVVCTVNEGTPACVGGMCAIGMCTAGWANCDGNVSNGCETNIASDPNNCGMCGSKCSVPNGTAGCSNEACTVAACNTGFANCDNNVANGCEVNTTSDPSNCGTCGRTCSVVNGTAGCSASTCTVAGCNTGYADCNGSPSACAVDTTNDPSNCGGCGDVCLTECGGAADHVIAASCGGSACSVATCAPGYADYDGKCDDGCECADSTTPTTCGAGSYALGTLPVGATPVSYSSNMFPAAPNEAYFTVTFSGNTNTSFHPKITLADPLNEFVMDITSDCTTAITPACNDTGSGEVDSPSGVTAWETSYTGPNPPADPNSHPVTGIQFVPDPLPSTNGTVYIKVYRKVALTACSNAYTLTVSN